MVRLAIGVALIASATGCGGSSSDTTSSTTAAKATVTTTTTEPEEQVATDFSAPGVAVIAHRGASGYAPEHTFAAYDLALDQGADYLEQDVQLTKDGQLVVLHDPSLDRTARGPAETCAGFVSQQTVEDVQVCDIGTWFNEANPDLADPAFPEQRIPTLDDVFENYGSGVRYYIEVKAPDDQPAMVETLLDLLDTPELDGPASDTSDPDLPPVVIQSFSAESLQRIHQLRPELPLVQLIRDREPIPDAAALDAIAEYAVAIGPPKGKVDAALVDAANERCLDVHVYTVNDPAEMETLLDAGVGAIFTNVPDVLADVLEGRPETDEICPARADGIGEDGS